MDLMQTIRGFERRLKAAGKSVDSFCAEARINRATWQRWKAGQTKPTFDAWLRVTALAEALPPIVARQPGGPASGPGTGP